MGIGTGAIMMPGEAGRLLELLDLLTTGEVVIRSREAEQARIAQLRELHLLGRLVGKSVDATITYHTPPWGDAAHTHPFGGQIVGALFSSGRAVLQINRSDGKGYPYDFLELDADANIRPYYGKGDIRFILGGG